ncbi:hypothetical protein RHSIM_Rhsim03G0210100 [Rhododendron simsii]|uniref:Uncharacterized protein n=1 Tax=Rhododendron simsii TaxID=118357 RepID=A0A834H654_RHOSS|nr:hypothetical protein RHSIM_Rhsim03G0210100 [Rhododendron simsii]
MDAIVCDVTTEGKTLPPAHWEFSWVYWVYIFLVHYGGVLNSYVGEFKKSNKGLFLLVMHTGIDRKPVDPAIGLMDIGVIAGFVLALPRGQSSFKIFDFEVDYESEENAQIVYSALAVDKELQPDKVKRQMTVSNGKLVVHFEAVEARFLRASFSAFVDVLTLATKTIEEFGQGMEL